MKKKKFLIIIFLICIGVIATIFYVDSRDIKVINRISPESVQYYYVYRELMNGSANEYLMAMTVERKAIPILKINKASYPKKLLINRKDNKLYLYNDIVYSSNAKGDQVYGRNLITYDLNSQKVKLSKQNELDEDNYYFLSENGIVEKIESVEKSNINAVQDFEDMIWIAYESNKIEIINRGGKQEQLIKKAELPIYYGIHDIKRYGEDMIIVGHNEKKEVVLTLMDSNLNILQQNNIGKLGNLDLVIGDNSIFGLVDPTEDGGAKQIIKVNKELQSEVIQKNVMTECLHYLSKDNEYIYFDINQHRYIVLNDDGKEKEDYGVIFGDNRYKYPYGSLYTN